MTKRRPWKKSELIKLKKMFLEGRSYEEIAKELNRTPKSVELKISNLRGRYGRSVIPYQNELTTRKMPARHNYSWEGWENSRLLQMHYSGMSHSEIAESLQRTSNAIKKQLEQIPKMGGFPDNYQPNKQVTDESVTDLPSSNSGISMILLSTGIWVVAAILFFSLIL